MKMYVLSLELNKERLRNSKRDAHLSRSGVNGKLRTPEPQQCHQRRSRVLLLTLNIFF